MKCPLMALASMSMHDLRKRAKIKLIASDELESIGDVEGSHFGL
jgi:hypothetical protein